MNKYLMYEEVKNEGRNNDISSVMTQNEESGLIDILFDNLMPKNENSKILEEIRNNIEENLNNNSKYWDTYWEMVSNGIERAEKKYYQATRCLELYQDFDEYQEEIEKGVTDEDILINFQHELVNDKPNVIALFKKIKTNNQSYATELDSFIKTLEEN